MTDPEATPQDTELGSESSTDEPVADETVADETAADEATPDIDEEEWKEAMSSDYQARLEEFDNVESQPVASPPEQPSQLSESDLEVQPPGGGGS